jgi:formiminoglutamase
MELASRGYMTEPIGPVNVSTWPVPYDAARADGMRVVLRDILASCVQFACMEAGYTPRFGFS